VSIIDPQKRPIDYWPTLKKFKSEEFVITKEIDFDFSVVKDMTFPWMMICSSNFKEMCIKEGLYVGFRELPCAFD
jgi:hypothetical protein